MSSQEPLDRSQPPKPGRPTTYQFPDFLSTSLDNGLRIAVLPSRRFPVVHAQLLLPAGGQEAPLDAPGLAALHGILLTEGSTERTGIELALAIEALGGYLASGAGMNMAYVEVGSLLSQHFDAGMDLLAEAALRPRFPEDQVERLCDEQAVDLLRRRSRPRALADDTFSEVIYDGTVYARPLEGTRESLSRIGRGDLLDFYRQHVGPEGSTLMVVGDVDPDAVVKRAEALFGGWPPAKGALTTPINPRQLDGREVHIVDRPGSAQTQLQLGHAGPPRSHPDFERCLLLNVLFGGKFTSRLNLNLREKNGFTYGAASSFVRRRGPGPFLARTAVATDVAGAATREILAEMERVCEAEVDTTELQETVDYILGVFPYTAQTVEDLSGRLESLIVFDLPKDHFQRYLRKLPEVTPAELHTIARTHLHPDRLAIVAVGPEEDLRPQLEGLGPITVHRA
ncbi:MAG: pitrilysin family protein [Acidobacteriota bacterium]